MPSPALHRFAIFLALCTLCLVAAVALGHSGVFPESERLAAILVTVLSIALAAWATVSDSRIAVKLTAWLLAAASAAIFAAPPVGRAGLAPVLFALVVAVATATSPAWLRGPRPVADEGFPSMRAFGWMAPLGVLIQVMLGAAYRYNLLPPWPHITGSLVVGGLLCFAGMAALQSYNYHGALKGAATLLLTVTGVQVALGMVAFAVRMAKEPEPWAIWLTAAHVVTGALTLGAATAFSLQVFYHVRDTLLVREAAV